MRLGLCEAASVTVDAVQVSPQPLADVHARVRAIVRPDRNLLWLYIMQMLLVFPFAWAIFLPMYFRYRTLRYRFDDDGIHASWGFFFRTEISLAYARIQDIHLRRGLFERWLGLGTVHVQTAAGAGVAGLVIEGMTEFDAVRDFLYAHMRGASGVASPTTPLATTTTAQLLLEIRGDLRAIRDALQDTTGARPSGPHSQQRP